MPLLAKHREASFREFIEKVIIVEISDLGNCKLLQSLSEFITKRNTSKVINIGLSASKFILDGMNLKWTLLFRASEHHFKSDEFHSACNNKSNLITLLKTHDARKIAMFSSSSFDLSYITPHSFRLNPRGFIADLKSEDEIKFYTADEFGGSWGIKELGPSLGSAQDLSLKIVDRCHENSEILSYAHSGYPGLQEVEWLATVPVRVVEYEVFQIEEYTHEEMGYN